MEREKMERPVKCCIDRCLTKTKSIKVKDIIYYLFPTDADWAQKWEKQIKDFDPTYKRKADDIVCSLHFAKSSMQPISRQLVDHALPIYFPQRAADVRRIKPPSETVSVQKTVKPIPDSTSPESKCCITSCPTKFDDVKQKIPGFKFPDDVEQRKKWTFIIELYNNQKIEWNKSMRICALHFGSASLTNENELCDGAKPSIFKHAIACRQKEIAKQQTQLTNQQSSPTKTVTTSINVPLHQQNAEKHSMTRRSAPIIARRLSLPYSKLPPLLPKPNLLKRENPIQVSGPNVSKIQRISLPINGTLTAISRPDTNVIGKRPVPALTKVVSNQPFLQRGNVSVLRKSMPPPQVNQLPPAILARLDNGTAKLIPVSKSSTAAHITRLPPMLKPAPRPIIKTYPKVVYVEPLMPTISKVQSIGQVQSVAKINTNTTPIISKAPPIISKAPENAANVSGPVVNERRVPDVIVIDDEEVEIAMAMKTNDDVDDDANVTASIKNGDQMQQYSVRDESAYKFPRILMERILEKKRVNEALEAEVAKWKKMAHKLNQQYRLQRATTTSETIDIS